MSLNRNLILCPPNYLKFDYVINPWMKDDTKFDLEVAIKQWTELYNLYMKLYPNHTFSVKPKEGLTELCFFGDSVFTYKNKAVFSRMATEERYDETDYVIQTIREMGIQGQRVPEDVFYEGSGETVVWNNKIIVGYGQRSNEGIIDYLNNEFNTEVIGLELIDSKYYHLDTALFPVSDDLIAIYEPAFSKESLELLEGLDVEILKVSEKSALDFALNSISLENNIIVHHSATEFMNQLSNRGFNIIGIDVSEFIKFGGGLKCLTFQQY